MWFGGPGAGVGGGVVEGCAVVEGRDCGRRVCHGVDFFCVREGGGGEAVWEVKLWFVADLRKLLRNRRVSVVGD